MSILDQIWKTVWENLDETASSVLGKLWFWFKLETLKAMVSINHETWVDTLTWKSKKIFEILLNNIKDLKIWWSDEDFLNRVIDSWLYQVCKEAWSFNNDESLLDLFWKMINDLVNSKRNDAMNPNQLQWWAIVEVSWRPQAKYIGSNEKTSYQLESAINFMKWCAEQINIPQWYSISDNTEAPSISTNTVISSLNENPNITDLSQLPQAA